jgi:hypothetical protein
MKTFPNQDKIYRVSEFLLYATEADLEKFSQKMAKELAMYFHTLASCNSSLISQVATTSEHKARNIMISNVVNDIFSKEKFCQDNTIGEIK